LLDHFQVDWPVVYGHSEGAGLAMLYGAVSQRAKMLILESPFVIAQESSYRHIQNMASTYSGSHLQQRLAQYHQDPDTVFSSWVSGVGEFTDGESPFGISLPVFPVRYLCSRVRTTNSEPNGTWMRFLPCCQRPVRGPLRIPDIFLIGNKPEACSNGSSRFLANDAKLQESR